MTFKIKILNIQPKAAGSTAVVTLGTGGNSPTLDKLQFTLGVVSSGTFNTTKVNGIRGFINGRPFLDLGSATVHNARRSYLGITNDTAEIVVDFTEPNAKSGIEQFLTCLPLSVMQDCRFEIDIDASASANLTLTALGHVRAPTNNPFIKKMRKISQGFAQGGEQVIYLPNGPSGSKLVRAWINEGTPGNITEVELRSRNAVGIEATRVELQKSQVHNGLTPQAGVVVLDFIEDGNLAGWFDTAKAPEVTLKLTGTAADLYTVYLEYIDPIDHL